MTHRYVKGGAFWDEFPRLLEAGFQGKTWTDKVVSVGITGTI